jgi:CheY-like chemotaxis protein
LLGEDIEVDWLTASGLPYIRANAPQLEQIVVNLCVNARDAMPRGGRLQLKVSSEPLPPALASIHATSGEDRFAVLSVEDDGEGMSPEVRDRIFEPFFTTKGVGKGTGLGLATVYAIMERHGGFIDVLSAPGQGTSFRLYFPAVEGQESGSGTFKASRTVEGRNRLVLVAEDDPQIRNLTARFLARAGFRVVTAMDGAEADALISKNAEELSLVILDAIMPHLRGPDVYLRMRARGSMVPCLIVTGYDFQSLDPIPELVRAMVLQKPFDGQQLFDRLAQLLEDT